MAQIQNYENQGNQFKREINYVCSHSQHPEFNQPTKEIKHVNDKLITGIPEHLLKTLMKVACKLLLRVDTTFEELTPQEQELCRKFETDNIYRFLTEEHDTVPEFHFNWTTVPRQTFEGKYTDSSNLPEQVQQPPAPPAPPHSPTSSSLSGSPHS